MRGFVLGSGCHCLPSQSITLDQGWTQLIHFFQLIRIVSYQVLQLLHANMMHLDEHIDLIDRFLEFKLDFWVILRLEIFASDSDLLLKTVNQSPHFLLNHRYWVFSGAINFVKQILENVSFSHNFASFLNERLVTLSYQRVVIGNFLESGLHWRLFLSRISLSSHIVLLFNVTLSTFFHFRNILFITWLLFYFF